MFLCDVTYGTCLVEPTLLSHNAGSPSDDPADSRGLAKAEASPTRSPQSKNDRCVSSTPFKRASLSGFDTRNGHNPFACVALPQAAHPDLLLKDRRQLIFEAIFSCRRTTAMVWPLARGGSVYRSLQTDSLVIDATSSAEADCRFKSEALIASIRCQLRPSIRG